MRRWTRNAALFAFALVWLAPPVAAQDGPVANWVPEVTRTHDFELSIANFMRGPEHIGQSPGGVNWTDDSEWVYFRWLPAGNDWNADSELWRVPADGGEPELIDDPLVADSLSLTFGGGAISPDRSLRATTSGGDLYLVDRETLEVERLTNTRSNKGGVSFSADGERLFYSEGGQIFSLDLESRTVMQLTDIRSGSEPEESEPEGHQAFLRDQQIDLFEYIRREVAEREEREEMQELRMEAQEIKPVWVGSRGNPGGFNIDPHGRYVSVQASQQASNTERVLVPEWITEDGYTAANPVRTKVGDAVGSTQMGIHPVGSDTIHWLEVDEVIQAHAELNEPSGHFDASMVEEVREGEVEIQSVQFRGWNDAGTHGLVSTGSIDNKHRWLLSVEAATGDLTVLHHLADSAWVAGPCSFCVGWLPDSDRAYFGSEATGYAHLYAIDADGTDLQQLTSGNWEVHSLEIREQRDHFILRTNEGSPYSQHMYRMDFDGSDRTRITEGLGNFDGEISPDGSRMAVVHSTQTRPSELFLMDYEPGAEMAQITTSPSEEFLDFPWIRAEIVEFTAEDGIDVPARIYRPSDMGVEPNGAAVLFVHGAGYLQNVHEWWSSYYREYMFHHFLAAQGFTVLDIDYRGSAGHGRDWRTAVYRHMGGADLSDYVDGVRYLTANEGIDPDRIGVYGGSYGGFMTLMALFTEPDHFTSGAALRSVTDWAHYNQGYTSNILNLPQDDPEAYEQSSPIYFAEGLEGHLLMSHSMYDTNVHFSDIVRLTQRLIELGKENWELAVQPTENHGIESPEAWTDLYRRIYQLFWTTLSAPGCEEGTGVCEMPVYGGG